MEKDTVERPPWMTTEFLEETLRSRECFTKSSVVDSSVHSAVGKGDNYTSVIYRVVVKFKPEDNSEEVEETGLIIKILSPIEIMAKFLKESKSFEKEIRMTSVVIPAMDLLLEEKYPGKKSQHLSAYCYHTPRPHTLILQDLTTLGYKMADRKTRLNLSHSIMAVKCLARFHAASVALNEKDPDFLNTFKTEQIYIEDNRQMMFGFMNTTFTALLNVVDRWSGFEKYPEKIRPIIPVMFDRLVELVKPKTNSFNVLNHGDCWVNNMLFHYDPDTGETDNVGLIDFQLSRFSSPALDLQYFIYTSPKEEVRSKYTDHLLDVYHKELSDTLKALHQDPNQYTLDQLKTEFEEKGFFGFVVACTVLTAVLAEPSEAFDLENIKEDGTGVEAEVMEKTYSGSRFKEAFQHLLPHFDSKGII